MFSGRGAAGAADCEANNNAGMGDDGQVARAGVDFGEVLTQTPPDLLERGVYHQIAISLKGGELREPGLANLAERLAKRVPLAPIAIEPATARSSGLFKSAARLLQAASARVSSRPSATTSRDVCVGGEQPSSSTTAGTLQIEAGR